VTEQRRQSIIIVGGGASGVILAAHLLRSSATALRVTLVEKRETFGQGIAYSTSLDDHLLNVSAMGMSALAHDPEHFWRWVRRHGYAGDADAPYYAPRRIYATYLREVLDDLVAAEPVRLRLVSEEAVSISTTATGVEVALANGSSLIGHVCVLAAGHDEQPETQRSFSVRIDGAYDGPIDPDATVLILGTGLSMVDAWLSLEARGHRGQIVALSRRGLLPSPHKAGKPIRLDAADIPLGTELSYFVRWFRDLVRATEARGGDWRDVVDGMRPFNQKIWQSWPASAKRRFMEHTKAWWDVHRHRMAPKIHEKLSLAVQSGRLRLVAGRLAGVEQAGDAFTVSVEHRQNRRAEALDVARIYDCTGITKDPSLGSIRIVRALIDQKLARPDAMKIGLDVTRDCAIVDADGEPSTVLYAVGPLTRGAFFEIDAVPDIRAQCSAFAARLVP
jgi:uncharacterized NAD(P)/FAD-binding protein YdhS